VKRPTAETRSELNHRAHRDHREEIGEALERDAMERSGATAGDCGERENGISSLFLSVCSVISVVPSLVRERRYLVRERLFP
jgi:hypothetical protein